MTKTLDLFRKFKLFRSSGKSETETAFDKRMVKIGVVRQTSVAHAVLFKTRSEPLEA